MGYPPVVVVESGGVPRTQVDEGVSAPAFTVVESGARPITLADNAPPIALFNPDGSPYTGGGANFITISDNQGYEAGQTYFYAAPWSTLPGEPNDDLVQGADYLDTIRINKDTPLDHFRMDWRWPLNLGGSITGVYFCSRGYGKQPIASEPTPYRIWETTAFNVVVNIHEWGGANANLASAMVFFFLTESAVRDDQQYEVALLLTVSDITAWWLQNQTTAQGSFTDTQGRTWDRYYAGLNPAGSPYYLYALDNFADAPFDTAFPVNCLDFIGNLVSTGAVLDTAYAQGAALAVEPNEGTGYMVASYPTMTLTGRSGYAASLIDQELTNAKWGRVGVTFPNTTTVLEQTGNTEHNFSPAANLVKPAAIKQYRHTIRLRPDLGRDWLFFQYHDGSYANGYQGWVNLATKTFGFNDGYGTWTKIAATITESGADRILTLTFQTAATTGLAVLLKIATAEWSATYAGDTAKGMKVLGQKLEALT